MPNSASSRVSARSPSQAGQDSVAFSLCSDFTPTSSSASNPAAHLPFDDIFMKCAVNRRVLKAHEKCHGGSLSAQQLTLDPLEAFLNPTTHSHSGSYDGKSPADLLSEIFVSQDPNPAPQLPGTSISRTDCEPRIASVLGTTRCRTPEIFEDCLEPDHPLPRHVIQQQNALSWNPNQRCPATSKASGLLIDIEQDGPALTSLAPALSSPAK